MALDKAIEAGKERRTRYRKGKSVSVLCRNHGACDWCRRNRSYADRRQRQAADEQLREFSR